MNSFEFGRPVRICGKVYFISNDMRKVAEELTKCQKEIEEIINSGEEPDEKAIAASCRKALMVVFGRDVFDEIFGEAFNFTSACQLFMFIDSEITEMRNELRRARANGVRVVPKKK